MRTRRSMHKTYRLRCVSPSTTSALAPDGHGDDDNSGAAEFEPGAGVHVERVHPEPLV